MKNTRYAVASRPSKAGSNSGYATVRQLEKNAARFIDSKEKALRLLIDAEISDESGEWKGFTLR